MFNKNFKPLHINATPNDLAGNDGIGRYILLPGSDGRAKEIAEHFENVTVKNHPRSHNIYMGTLNFDGKKIDVATVSTGMGCASIEIILHELFQLGGKRFLRIGTAGSLQPFVKVGDLINVQASVRDEGTSVHYLPAEVPAIASLEFISSILLTAERLGLSDIIHTGIVHCKSSFYARQFAAGPRSTINQAYLSLMSEAGILASEMETATLFIQSHLYNFQLKQQGNAPENQVLAGAILAIISTLEHGVDDSNKSVSAVKNGIQLALETIKTLASQERLV